MRDAPTRPVEVETPLGLAQGVELDGKKQVLVAILRAGLGVLDGMLMVLPSARVGHVGLYRDPKLRTAVEYYLKLPHSMAERDAIVVSSVLATGGSAAAAVRRVQESGARSVRFACLVACHGRRARASTTSTPTCPSTPARSTRRSMRAASSCRASATWATACTARSREQMSDQAHRGDGRPRRRQDHALARALARSTRERSSPCPRSPP